MCPYPKRMRIIPSYLSVLKLQNFTVQQSYIFQKNGKKLSWVIAAINQVWTTNSIMNLSHTLCVIADPKALCFILYSSGNIQIKSCWVQCLPAPSLSFIKLAKAPVSRGLRLQLNCTLFILNPSLVYIAASTAFCCHLSWTRENLQTNNRWKKICAPSHA